MVRVVAESSEPKNKKKEAFGVVNGGTGTGRTRTSNTGRASSSQQKETTTKKMETKKSNTKKKIIMDINKDIQIERKNSRKEDSKIFWSLQPQKSLRFPPQCSPRCITVIWNSLPWVFVQLLNFSLLPSEARRYSIIEHQFQMVSELIAFRHHTSQLLILLELAEKLKLDFFFC